MIKRNEKKNFDISIRLCKFIQMFKIMENIFFMRKIYSVHKLSVMSGDFIYTDFI